ncbi:MAG TPA: hypothetical protein VFJ23_00205 [Candidatus Nitrosotalea sp.]|nr:hypothetical protein [Candidatus Nitrosotalea sp.]
MTGKEAKEILSLIDSIRDFLLVNDNKQAFYYMGVLSENLSRIVEIDRGSFNPTVRED